MLHLWIINFALIQFFKSIDVNCFSIYTNYKLRQPERNKYEVIMDLIQSPFFKIYHWRNFAIRKPCLFSYLTIKPCVLRYLLNFFVLVVQLVVPIHHFSFSLLWKKGLFILCRATSSRNFCRYGKGEKLAHETFFISKI